MTQGDAAVRVFVAVGSNVQPERHLATAMREMTRTWPDVRFSSAYQNTAVGFDGPQSPAEFTSKRSGPYVSTISAARAGVHLLTG